MSLPFSQKMRRLSALIPCLLVLAVLSDQAVETYVDPFPDPGLSTNGGLWPLPQKIKYQNENRTIRKGAVSIIFEDPKQGSCDILDFARRTYEREWFFPNRAMINKTPNSFRLIITLHSKCPEKNEYPQQNMSEEYRLVVPPSGDATLEADEVWGVLRGLETFSQLIFQKNGQYYVRAVDIHDWPEYPVRASRHFLPKSTILRQLDIMAANKFNLLHWHIVDSQSFPYVSKKFPNLSEKGAYTQQHIYSKSAVQDILDHARLRGIRVMVEFDTPGHMGSWKGQLGLLAECKDQMGHVVPSNLIDPSFDNNYKFLKSFFDEILSVFPERFIHLGGDEVSFWLECWKGNPKIRDFMERKGMGDNFTQLEDYHYGKLQDLMRELFGNDETARMIFWQEVFQFNNPYPNAIAHLWQLSEDDLKKSIQDLTSKGHQVIVSSGWYLNYIQYGKDYDKYYYHDIRNFNGTEEQKKMVLGGIAAVWGEFINSANVETVLWPRASAVAERLWSNIKSTPSADDAWPRLHEHSCRLTQRGFRMIPLNGPDYCPTEFEESSQRIFQLVVKSHEVRAKNVKLALKVETFNYLEAKNQELNN
ncbi:Beta-N-acetylhexosaminidase [Aphelenchoides bicaudatus]|nr:Beta-N-acetylhexosaminidase [Aphelenchoides bicaudatus]